MIGRFFFIQLWGTIRIIVLTAMCQSIISTHAIMKIDCRPDQSANWICCLDTITTFIISSQLQDEYALVAKQRRFIFWRLPIIYLRA